MKRMIALIMALMMSLGLCAQAQGDELYGCILDIVMLDENGNEIQPTFTANTWTDESGAQMKYWLYAPACPDEDTPLIVYLHGGSGKGDDLGQITAGDGLPKFLQDGAVSPRAYVLIPQLTNQYKGWVDAGDSVIKLIDYVKASCSISAGNVSLTGHSMGGTGAWQMALKYPDEFSSVAPMSGSIRMDAASVQTLKGMPVWAFVGSEDRIVSPSYSIEFVRALKTAGADAQLTVIQGADHFAVPGAYLTSGVLDWLAAHVK